MSENYNGYTVGDTGDTGWGPAYTQLQKDIIDKLPAQTSTFVAAQHVHNHLVNASNTATALTCGSSSVGLVCSTMGVAAINPTDLAPSMVFSDGAQTARILLEDTDIQADAFITGVGHQSGLFTDNATPRDGMFMYAENNLTIAAQYGDYMAIVADGQDGGQGNIYIEDARLQTIQFDAARGIQIMPNGIVPCIQTINDGSGPGGDMLGFFGATAQYQAAHPSNITDVITLLQAYGLCQ